MRATTILAGVFFAATALALPLDTSAITSDVSAQPIAKRQLGLGGVTSIVGGVVGEVTGTLTTLLPTVLTTLNGLTATVDGLLQNVESADFDTTLNEVESILDSTISDVKAVTAAVGVDLSSELVTVETVLSAAVTEAEGLLASVQSLVGLVSVSGTLNEVEVLAAELVDLLAGLA